MLSWILKLSPQHYRAVMWEDGLEIKGNCNWRLSDIILKTGFTHLAHQNGNQIGNRGRLWILKVQNTFLLLSFWTVYNLPNFQRILQTSREKKLLSLCVFCSQPKNTMYGIVPWSFALNFNRSWLALLIWVQSYFITLMSINVYSWMYQKTGHNSSSQDFIA